jgi:hypothetical protein
MLELDVVFLNFDSGVWLDTMRVFLAVLQISLVR